MTTHGGEIVSAHNEEEELKIAMCSLKAHIRTLPRLDLEGYLKNRHTQIRGIKHFRIPLFILRKMGPRVVSSALFNFAKICNPPWYIFNFIEYFDESFLEGCREIFLARLSEMWTEGIENFRLLELTDALNRISLFSKYDLFLAGIIHKLPIEIIQAIKHMPSGERKGIYLSYLLDNIPNQQALEIEPSIQADALKSGETLDLVTAVRDRISISLVTTVEVSDDMSCSIFQPLPNETTAGATLVKNVTDWLKNPKKSEIVIMRGHGLPENALDIIQHAQPKIVVFGGCQGIDIFFSRIASRRKEGRDMEWMKGVVYIGTTRLGRAQYNDTITHFFMSQIRQAIGVIDLTIIKTLTNGDYVAFSLN